VIRRQPVIPRLFAHRSFNLEVPFVARLTLVGCAAPPGSASFLGCLPTTCGLSGLPVPYMFVLAASKVSSTQANDAGTRFLRFLNFNAPIRSHARRQFLLNIWRFGGFVFLNTVIAKGSKSSLNDGSG
jgi:hypothetical protein